MGPRREGIVQLQRAASNNTTGWGVKGKPRNGIDRRSGQEHDEWLRKEEQLLWGKCNGKDNMDS